MNSCSCVHITGSQIDFDISFTKTADHLRAVESMYVTKVRGEEKWKNISLQCVHLHVFKECDHGCIYIIYHMYLHLFCEQLMHTGLQVQSGKVSRPIRHKSEHRSFTKNENRTHQHKYSMQSIMIHHRYYRTEGHHFWGFPSTGPLFAYGGSIGGVSCGRFGWIIPNLKVIDNRSIISIS